MRRRFRVIPALALLVVVVLALPACGRKAKPQPLWGKATAPRVLFRTR